MFAVATEFMTLPTVFREHVMYTESLARVLKYTTMTIVDKTKDLYRNAWIKFTAWLPHDFNPLHASGPIVALYLGDLIAGADARAIGSQIIDNASAAISYYFHLANRSSPTGTEHCKLLRKDRMLTARKSVCV